MVPPPFPTTVELLAGGCFAVGFAASALVERRGGTWTRRLATVALALGLCLLLWSLYVRVGVGIREDVMR